MAATLVVVAAGALSSRGNDPSRLLIDRVILVQLLLAAATALAGLVLALTVRGPSDPLHFVYAAIVVGGLPVVRYAVHRRARPSFGRWIAVAALVVMGALLRSFMTGR